jgi:hypothetical protein
MSTDSVAADTSAPVPPEEPEEWRPRNVHFGWLLVASLVVVGTLAALIWTGALAPRLSRQGVHIDQAQTRLEVNVRMRNAAATPVRLSDISTPAGFDLRSADLRWDSASDPRNGRRHASSSADLDRQDVELAPGGRLRLVLVYEIDDCATAASGPRNITLTAKTFIGITRSEVIVPDLLGFGDVASPAVACSAAGTATYTE